MENFYWPSGSGSSPWAGAPTDGAESVGMTAAILQKHQTAKESKSKEVENPPDVPTSQYEEAPPYIETNPAATHPGASSEWHDPRAGIDLDVAVRSRVARRAVYEARNPPSIVRHLAQAFVGKNSAYTKSTQYTVGPNGARKLMNASMFVDNAGFLYDYKEPPSAPKSEEDSREEGPRVAYPRDLRPMAPIGKYRPRGMRSTRLSIREDAKRKWQ